MIRVSEVRTKERADRVRFRQQAATSAHSLVTLLYYTARPREEHLQGEQAGENQ